MMDGANLSDPLLSGRVFTFSKNIPAHTRFCWKTQTSVVFRELLLERRTTKRVPGAFTLNFPNRRLGLCPWFVELVQGSKPIL
jgi:hypothetical protein